MRYFLHVTALADEKRTVYAYCLSDFAKIIETGSYIAEGEAHQDPIKAGHIFLQRTLRTVAAQEGVLNLNISFDSTMTEIAFDILEVVPLIHPKMHKTTKRVLSRFTSVEYSSAEYGEDQATVPEATALDIATDRLEYAQSLKGCLVALYQRFTNSKNYIR
ncbi:hypothetical protein [Shouchella clausii]|uniref:hypothetical protein n=1 Tax=Shouchella clausii TaxID=79880 RepID=UPI000BA76ADE|nr:hypothetical protein [Shouchella clausii]PAD19122.1 hypothetical protein CHH73_03405 [Shouchella clausii]